MNLTNDAWRILFDKYKIVKKVREEGFFVISATQIKEVREARLMTKFDHSVNLPSIFKENHFTILPITRGDYIISHFSAYHNFEEIENKQSRVFLPSNIQSISPQYITSEAVAINCAYACGIFDDFLQDENLIPTVNGRMSSGAFSFDILNNGRYQTINVKNSQIEIDAAFEGIKYLAIVEAKRDISNDFLVRQIYYPFRAWRDRVSKIIKPVFVIFSNGVFYLYQYEFTDYMNYNSLSLVKQKNYIISNNITLSKIEEILNSVNIVSEPKVAFPQADSMVRIINLLEMLSEHAMSKQEITDRNIFDDRQTNYYTTAGRYIGFIEKGEKGEDGNIYFSLTRKGQYVMSLSYQERQMEIIKAILCHKVFNEILRLHLKTGEMPEKNEIIRVMKYCHIYNVTSKETYTRRASTVKSWIEWILTLVEDE